MNTLKEETTQLLELSSLKATGTTLITLLIADSSSS